jgi:hypothetical protein
MIPIYIVTSGEYSDYRIRGVYSTRKGAEKQFAEVQGEAWDYVHQIEEYELDAPAPDDSDAPAYEAEIDLETGAITEEPGEQWRAVATKTETMRSLKKARTSSTQSQQHANKLAVEARQKWLRERA